MRVEHSMYCNSIINILEDILMLNSPVQANESFFNIGVDSVKAVLLLEQLNLKFDLNLGVEVIFDYSSIDELAFFLCEKVNSMKEPVNLVSMYCNSIVSILEDILKSDYPIQAQDSFFNIGVDSVKAVLLIERLNLEFNLRLGVEVIFDYSSIEDLAIFLNTSGISRNEPVSNTLINTQSKAEGLQSPGIKSDMKLSFDFKSGVDPFIYIRNIVIETLADLIPLSKDEIVSKTFYEIGVNSILAVEFIEKINSCLKISIGIESLFDYNDLDAFVRFVLEQFNLDHETGVNRSLETNPDEQGNSIKTKGIAVIGISGKFPEAKNLDVFWENLLDKKCSIKEVDRGLWKNKDFYSVDGEVKNKSVSKWGGLLDDIQKFDADFFNISPREAERMDPQQRILLEETYKAFDDSGYNSKRLASRKVGVFVGARFSDYINKDIYSNNGIESQMFLGSDMGIMSGRVSYFFNLTGPCITLDTACSSGLVATHYACQSILTGESELAVAGSVFVMPSSDFLVETSKTGMLSPDGMCRTFDNDANGIAISEGAGVVILKSLEQAIADNDNIYAVISGSAVNQDGKTHGITAPSSRSQERLVLTALQNANFTADSIDYIEAHGTGTKLGDPIEVKALSNAFKEHSSSIENKCYIGSHKPNIGHSITTAGMAGLLKTILVLKNNKIPPTIGYSKRNEHIDLENSPFLINTSTINWAESPLLRRAGVSSFGFSGTNSHVLLEQFKNSKRAFADNTPYLIPISAKTISALKTKVTELFLWINKNAAYADLCDIAKTLQIGRNHYNYRLAFLVQNLEELKIVLNDVINDTEKFSTLKRVHNSSFIHEENKLEFTAATNSVELLDYLKKIKISYENGAEVEWQNVNKINQARFISLPSYPFEGKDFWINNEVNITSQTSSIRLTDKFLDDEAFCGFAYSKHIKNSERIIADHEINGRNIVPAAYYIDVVAEVYERIGHVNSLVFKDVSLLRPGIVEDALRIKVLVENIEGELGFKISKFDDDSHCYVRGLLGSSAMNESQALTFSEISNTLKYKRSLKQEEVYNILLNQKANYGKSLQVIKEFYKGDYEIFALLEGDGKVSDKCVLNPSILDGALQTLLLFGDEGDTVRLPFAFGEIVVVKPLRNKHFVYGKENDGCFDLTIFDEDGELCVILKQISIVKEKADQSLKLFKPEWVKRQLPLIDKKQVLTNHKHILIVENSVEDEGISSEIILQCKGASIYKYLIDGKKRRKAENQDGYTLIESLRDIDSIDTIYFVHTNWTIEAHELPDVIEVNNDIIAFYNFAKQLIPVLGTKALHLKIILNGYNSIRGELITNTSLSAIHGFAKSAAKEFLNWNIQVFDTDLKVIGNSLEYSIQHLLSVSELLGEGEFALRNNDIYQRELVLIENTIEKPSLLINRGVYVILGGAGGIGLEVCKWLYKNFNAQIVIIGRSELSQSKKLEFNNITDVEDSIEYFQCDISDFNQLNDAIGRVKAKYHRINGVIHSAIALKDLEIRDMDESSLLEVLAPKVEGCINLFKAIQNVDIDFMLFFSSCQSFLGNAGQSNYSAASLFEDTFVNWIQQQLKIPVKTINWGYWGNVGIVAGDRYKQLMASQGFFSVDANEGMNIIDLMLKSDWQQVMAIKASDETLKKLGVNNEVKIYALPEINTSLTLQCVEHAKSTKIDTKNLNVFFSNLLLIQQNAKKRLQDIFYKLNNNNAVIEWNQVKELINRGVIPFGFEKLASELLNIMLSSDYSNSNLFDANTIEDIKDIKAYEQLLTECLENFENILVGKTRATDILFPNASLQLVEGIYRDNLVADYFTSMVAKTIAEYVKIRSSENKKIRILEIGSGTGSTAKNVCQLIEKYQDQISYTYTDISLAFTNYGKDTLGKNYSFLEFKQLDIETDIISQGYRLGDFDIVLATNVLHATSNIDKVLENSKRFLKKNGLILINEMTHKQAFLTLTFGLLDGWWKFNDIANREHGSPIITKDTWGNVLKNAGFEKINMIGIPDEFDAIWSQNVIIAESNGNVRLSEFIPTSRVDLANHKTTLNEIVELATKVDSIQNIHDALLNCISHSTKLLRTQIDAEKQFSDYGVDSIVGMEIISNVNKSLKISLKNTILFDYSNLNTLEKYIVQNFGDSINERNNLSNSYSDESKSVDLKGTKEFLSDIIVGIVGNILGINKSDVDIDKEFMLSGIDSIVSGELVSKLNKTLKISLKPTVLFNYATIRLLTEYVLENFKLNLEIKQSSSLLMENGSASVAENQLIAEKPSLNRSSDIAIIGMSGCFADYKNVDEFWKGLSEERNSIREIPASRWDSKKHFDSDIHKLDKTNSKWCGYVDGIEDFDPIFFNISGNEAKYIDPQQRLFLEECYKALEDAGYVGESLVNQKCGVFAGCMEGDYLDRLKSMGIKLEPHAFWGSDSSILASRVAYYMNLQGPCVTINTACSSSLVSVHLACSSISSGETDIALAGGVYVSTTPQYYILSSNAGMFSPDGQCHTFDNKANGFVLGEGCGVVVLKSLDKAIEDKDYIHAVIRGTGINQDGKTNGITAPSSLSQSKLLTEVYDKVKINPETISYIEAHGTGTKLGDPIEFEALTNAFRKYTDLNQFCGIGSLKTNIGHLAAAAGVASLIKVVLSLKHKTIPSSLNFDRINENISVENSPFYINTKLAPWIVAKNNPRRAAISSFGFSGTNAHMVVDEWNAEQELFETQKQFIIPFSAKTKGRVIQYLELFADYLDSKINNRETVNKHLNLQNIEFTLQQGRKQDKFRILFVVNSIDELIGSIKKYLAGSGVQNCDDNFNNEVSTLQLQHVIEDQRDLQLINNWLKGDISNWDRSRNRNSAFRISLPHSVIQKQRYWFDDVNPQGYDSDLEDRSIRPNLSLRENSKSFDEANGLLYFQKSWIENKLNFDSTNLKRNSSILLFYANESVHADFSMFLSSNNLGLSVVFVKIDNYFQKISERRYVVNPDIYEDLVNLYNDLEANIGIPSSILNLAGINQTYHYLHQYAIFYLNLSKVLISQKRASDIQIVHGVIDNNSDSSNLQKALNGFGKTLAEEYNRLHLKTVILKSDGLSEGLSSESLNALLSESFTSGHGLVKYTGRKRERIKISTINVDIADQRVTSKLRQNGVYIVTGGLGGVGKSICLYLSEKYKARILVIGRSQLDNERIAIMKEVQSYGGQIQYVNGDISNYSDVRYAFEKAKSAYSQINGIIHCAGVIKGDFIKYKKQSDFREVLNPKVDGVLNIDRAIQAENIDFFVMFSSIASEIGTITKSDYSYANSFMNYFAESREIRRRKGEVSGLTISICWPFWMNGGMQIQQEGVDHMKDKVGLDVLLTDEGLLAFENALKFELSNIIVAKGVESKIISKISLSEQDVITEPISITSNQNIVKETNTMNNRLFVKDEIIRICSELFELQTESIEESTSFEEFGMDSIFMMRMLNRLEKAFNISVDADSIYTYPTPGRLADFLLTKGIKFESKNYSSNLSVKNESVTKSFNPVVNEKHLSRKTGKVAIIGAACHFPGSSNLNQYWNNLLQGNELFKTVNFNRWEDLWHNKILGINYKEKPTIGWGGFLDEIDVFDAEYFGISDESAQMMDPQQRKILTLADELFKNSGYFKEEISGKRISVLIGGGDSFYVKQHRHLIPNENYKSVLVSMIPNMMAARVSDYYNLKGESGTIETACSSSLVAIDRACNDIIAGKSEMAIAGGIKLLLDPFEIEGFEKAGVLSKDGKVRVFDENAQGCILGEGAALVLLKDFDAAIKDGDQILSVICSTAINNDGKTMGLTVPNKDGQKDAIIQAIEKSGIDPELIRYFEAHGTGTLLGDPIEIKAASEAFERYTSKKQFCAVGSVKSNMGHLLQAGGMAGLFKALLTIQNKTIVPTLNCTSPHPRFNFENTPFYPALKAERIDGNEIYAGVSAFGFGGTNAHVILQNFAPQLYLGYSQKRSPLALEKANPKHYWLGREIVKVNGGNHRLIVETKYKDILAKVSSGELTVEEASSLL